MDQREASHCSVKIKLGRNGEVSRVGLVVSYEAKQGDFEHLDFEFKFSGCSIKKPNST